MNGATIERTFPVKADRLELERAASDFFNVLEEITFQVPGNHDPAVETREVNYENIAEVAQMIDVLDVELAGFQHLRQELARGLSYLLQARSCQEVGDA